MARIHNGGPQGYEKQSTREYARKIEAILESTPPGNVDDVRSLQAGDGFLGEGFVLLGPLVSGANVRMVCPWLGASARATDL